MSIKTTIPSPIHFIKQSYIDFTTVIPPIRKYGNIQNIPSHKINLEGFAYLHPQILDDIKSQEALSTGNRYDFHFEGIDITFIYASGTSLNPSPSKQERFLLFYTCFLIYLFKTKLGKHLNKLMVQLICYKGKKTLPNPNEKLSSYHINSGVTISQIPIVGSAVTEAEILVYRKEEMIKVLTHEMIHAFGLDAKNIPEEKEQYINEHFKLNCKSANINESFTDSLACLINTVIYTHLQRPKDFNKQYAINIKKESQHILNQAIKVLVHNKYFIQKSQQPQLSHPSHVCESTHVTSYYVLKAVVYSNLSEFIQLLSINHMNIDINAYIEFIQNTVPKFEKILEFRRQISKNLNMTILDILHILPE
jgi:hypothetical protein